MIGNFPHKRKVAHEVKDENGQHAAIEDSEEPSESYCDSVDEESITSDTTNNNLLNF